MSVSKETLKQFIKEGYMDDKEKNVYYAPSGCTVKNLACTGRKDDCYQVGSFHSLVGASDTGKSLEALTALAAIANDEKFVDHYIFYDDTEANLAFPIEEMFGKKLADRLILLSIEPVEFQGVTLKRSITIEQYRYNINRLIELGVKFVYCTDSWDGMSTLTTLAKMADDDKALESGKDEKGSYNMDKQKKAAEIFPAIKSAMAETESIGFIVSQGKKNIDPNPFAKKNRRSGGDSLKFFSLTESWIAKKADIKQTVNGNTYVIGKKVIYKLEKNHQNGKLRPVEYVINETGIDDVLSNINYLIDMKHWTKSGRKIKVPEWEDFDGGEDKLVQYIEDSNKEEELTIIVENVWNDIESKLTSPRKKRFE